MAASHRASAAASTNNPTTLFNITVPATVQAGDKMLVLVTSRDHTAASAFPAVAGGGTGVAWTRIAESADRKGTLWRADAVADSASSTINVTGCIGSSAGGMSAYIGADNPLNITVESNASGNETHAGITVTAGSMYFIGICNTGNDNTVSGITSANFGGMANRWEKLSTGGSDSGATWWDDTPPSSGATGNITWLQTNGTTVSIVGEIPEAVTDITGTVAVTTAATTASASGKITVTGAAAATAANTTSAASGKVTVTGTIAVTTQDTTGAASGSVGNPSISGTVAVTTAATIAAASGKVTVIGAVASTAAGTTSTASGKVSIKGVAAATAANTISAASGKVTVTGTIAATLGNTTGAASGAVGNPAITGTISAAAAPTTAAASGKIATTGSIAVTLQDTTGAAMGSVIGALIPSAGFTVNARGRRFEVIAGGRAFTAAAAQRSFSVASVARDFNVSARGRSYEVAA